MKNQAFAVGLWIFCTMLGVGTALAQTSGTNAPSAGFYGGIALRDNGAESTGVTFGAQTSAWSKFASPLADDTASRALFFGGYRWANDVALEGSLNTSDRYALHPDNPSGRSGVGLTLQPTGPSVRAWNANVFGSWSFLRRFALYGRLGYAQADAGAASVAALPIDPHKGVNYGVGLRYDVNRSLGLRLEYARFARFAGETVQGGVLPDSDQLQLGVQLRF